ncbi:hypothetical protein R1flu_016922 [Riccia fluitans]|uniref:F-box domain-containing protein n=1 Tax=Riccia fluitans TaxID=41844 RepID=A0ABD1YN88_9MARC
MAALGVEFLCLGAAGREAITAGETAEIVVGLKNSDALPSSTGKRMSSSSMDITSPRCPDGFLELSGCDKLGTELEDLSDDLLGEIVSWLPDARDQARVERVSTRFRKSCKLVKTVKFLCRMKNVQRCTGPNAKHVTPFKDIVMSKLVHLTCVERLRLEIEDEMQASRFKEEVIEKNSLWISDDKFVLQWLPPVSANLISLTIIDYGQQAIFHQTMLLQHLSNFCKNLQFLELRNMFLDCAPTACSTADQMKPTRLSGVKVLTLRCVKLTENGLKDLNDCMPNLITLTLVTIVGLRDARFKSDKLKVLCLGLATRVKSVKLEVNALTKLQLKMACPDELRVEARSLQCLAVCMDKRQDAIVEFKGVNKLRELLMGASEFSTLDKLCSANPGLEKVFLDVPCMTFEDDGGWKAVLSHVPLNLPNMKHIKIKCTKLHTLSIGPGLWYSLEQDTKTNPETFSPTWPVLTTLILQIIVQELEVSLKLFRGLLESIPSLENLEVYVHKDSNMELEEFGPLKELFPTVQWKLDWWKKGLKFNRFSF